MTLEELRVKIKELPINGKGNRVFPDELKVDIVEYHYQSGQTLASVAKECNVHFTLIGKWKKKFGRQKTAFVFGDGMRNDLRTKALCVQEHKTTKKTQATLAKEYGVAQGTINNWIKDYGDTYEDLLDTRDGVPYLVKETKMVYGDENIRIILEIKEKHVAQLDEIMKTMHENGLPIGKALEKAIAKKTKDAKDDIKTLKKADAILAEG